MLRSRVGRDKSAGQMDTSSKVKNLRWVSNLGVGVSCEVDGRNDDLVLLEEAAVREAEARIVIHLFCRGGGGALDRDRRLPGVVGFGDLVLMGSVLPCDDDENDILSVLLICTEWG